MIIYQTQKISNSFYLVRALDYCIYLFFGKYGAIIETGISQIIPDVIKNINNFGIDKASIKYIIILHSHFDHSGGVSLLKKHFPDARILGSQRTSEILKDEYQISLIEKGLKKTSENPLYSGGEIFIKCEEVEVVKDKDEINLGKDILLHIIETQGHSPCAISIYEKKNNAFLISDSFGSIYPSTDTGDNILKDTSLSSLNNQFQGIKVWTTAFDNYDLYISNFEKIKNIEKKYLGFGHIGILEGEIVPLFFDFSKKEAQKLKQVMKEKNLELNDTEKVLNWLCENEFKELLYYFPPFVVKWGIRAMFKSMGIVK